MAIWFATLTAIQMPVAYTWIANLTLQDGTKKTNVEMTIGSNVLTDAIKAYNGKYRGCSFTKGPALK